jgi:feruloyl esterase
MRMTTHRFLAAAILATLAAGAAAQPAPEAACAALAGRVVPPAAIGLPSGAATVGSAVFAPPAPAGRDAQGGPVAALPPHCSLVGEIAPLDPAAPPIRFQVNLPIPDAWNGKAVQYGGGGFNGVLITGLAPLRDAVPGAPTPLARGYLTFGTDSGHQNERLPEIQAFALNEEALTNFAHAAYKKVRDVAHALAVAAYGRAPARTYFFGGSEGGREGLVVAQRFPADYDGVVSVVPVVNWVALQVAGAHRGGTLQGEGGWLDPGKVALAARAVLNACDTLDGLADGIVSHTAACAAAFDPATLRCPDGASSGETCLSDRQVAALRGFRAPFRLPFALANDLAAYPGFGFGGEAHPDGMAVWLTGPEPPQVPLPSPQRQGRVWYYGGGALRYVIARDPGFDPRGFDPAPHAARLREVSALMDATDPDLSAFAARGGRLILKENLSDYAQSPEAGIEYYRSVVARMGQEAADRLLRLYTVPGANHGGRVFGPAGAPMPSHLDLLALLEAWVEEGRAPPDAPVLTAHAAREPFGAVASRPMCRWPAYPRYAGSGDPRQAASFACVTP